MSSFLDPKAAKALIELKAPHFPFERGKCLKSALSWCFTDYHAKASIGDAFEARGILVTGLSRQGKTKELTRLVSKFNEDVIVMPDGRPAKIIQCVLSGKVTWKDLGVKILKEFGYELKGRNTQAEIWDKVVKYSDLQGVVGIHFDECQHIFSETGDRTNQQFLDSFKTLLKDPRRPLMLILSGIPELESYIEQEEQLHRLLRHVHLAKIDMSRSEDLDEMTQLAFSYADEAGLDFAPLATQDFLERLAFTCSDRWGLVIEMLIEAYKNAMIAGDKLCTLDHFSQAYAVLLGGSAGYSPLTVRNYRDCFSSENLKKMLDRTAGKKMSRN
ncbi:hypothetical protein DKT77_19305 [Meridianimarinicoccus roseus]|uniref:ORC1/DEAH AAA+ ATPase domain-containing protein n=1 Tax=Meridianimarinicoccus roseus TaxID=2072018 RepID=A0A2V2LGF4_9RHOB|nr:ATP-binding protein [Meridianimarinicoccus roseus]PWR00993.1 hypothetical protein DKT77_19305 [Meridianimarinicoccus roseus]